MRDASIDTNKTTSHIALPEGDIDGHNAKPRCGHQKRILALVSVTVFVMVAARTIFNSGGEGASTQNIHPSQAENVAVENSITSSRVMETSMAGDTELVQVKDAGGENVSFRVYTHVPRDPLEGKRRRLPQCIVIGASKTGTYALKTFLGLHPDIVIPDSENEGQFFNNAQNYAKGFSWYLSLMPPSLPGQITLEKTPGYIYSPEAPERIYRMNKNIKLILVVREPIERSISCYVHHLVRKKSNDGTFLPYRSLEDQFLQTVEGVAKVNPDYYCVDGSLYSKYFQRWLDRFRADQIHVVDGDNFARNPVEELQLVEKFLGVKPRFNRKMFKFNDRKGFYCWRGRHGEKECMPDRKGRQHPAVDSKLKDLLLDFFRPYNQLFYSMTERYFSWTTR